MELRHLRYFVAEAEESSFRRAAERLRVAQPAVSRQIRNLEDELGVQLFERSKAAVRLSPAGEFYLKTLARQGNSTGAMRMRLMLLLLLAAAAMVTPSRAAESGPKKPDAWNLGTPIVTYWAGPAMTDATAKQMAEGGFNLVWCREEELDTAHRHGLRAMLQAGLIAPASLDNPTQREQLDALIARVRTHPALYAYFITDEPNASTFVFWGKLVAHLRERDRAHLAYLNLFPTYASNEQLGNKGDLVTAYREHLRQYLDIVKPALISYDHYQFAVSRDHDQYFLNLSLIQRAAQEAGLPFLNIVQACTWTPSMRIPNPDELRYLVHTTAAYGAQGVSYYVYCHPGHSGGIALPDGTPTPLFQELKSANREFVALAKELQSFQLLGAGHTAMKEPGCTPLAVEAAFRIEAGKSSPHPRGFLLTCFGLQTQPTRACVVNLDYTTNASATLIGPTNLETFDATKGTWTPANGRLVELRLRPGEGKLVRLQP
jgi:hypothetical protein